MSINSDNAKELHGEVVDFRDLHGGAYVEFTDGTIARAESWTYTDECFTVLLNSVAADLTGISLDEIFFVNYARNVFVIDDTEVKIFDIMGELDYSAPIPEGFDRNNIEGIFEDGIEYSVYFTMNDGSVWYMDDAELEISKDFDDPELQGHIGAIGEYIVYMDDGYIYE